MAEVQDAHLDGTVGPTEVVEPTPRKGARRRDRVLDANAPLPEAKGPHKATSNNARREP